MGKSEAEEKGDNVSPRHTWIGTFRGKENLECGLVKGEGVAERKW